MSHSGLERGLYEDPVYRNALPDLLERLGSVSGRTVVEMGCGDGYCSLLLASRGARVVGFDPRPDAIRRAQSLAAEAKLAERCSFVLGRAEAIALPDRCADVVFSRSSLQTSIDAARSPKRSGSSSRTARSPCSRTSPITRSSTFSGWCVGSWRVPSSPSSRYATTCHSRSSPRWAPSSTSSSSSGSSRAWSRSRSRSGLARAPGCARWRGRVMAERQRPRAESSHSQSE